MCLIFLNPFINIDFIDSRTRHDYLPYLQMKYTCSIFHSWTSDSTIVHPIYLIVFAVRAYRIKGKNDEINKRTLTNMWYFCILEVCRITEAWKYDMHLIGDNVILEMECRSFITVNLFWIVLVWSYSTEDAKPTKTINF